MPGINEAFDDGELTPPLDRLEPDAPEDERDDDSDDQPDHEADDREHRVAHRPNPLPSREEDEEELAEADILDELDLEDYDKRGGFKS
ncbi:MAG TPA: hypothetical protein VK607_24875 [Kofleriaceae bacterium]|nr:hypothetical protein [Kofleriaceae bacterium]